MTKISNHKFTKQQTQYQVKIQASYTVHYIIENTKSFVKKAWIAMLE
jgi:outer membrane protease